MDAPAESKRASWRTPPTRIFNDLSFSTNFNNAILSAVSGVYTAAAKGAMVWSVDIGPRLLRIAWVLTPGTGTNAMSHHLMPSV